MKQKIQNLVNDLSLTKDAQDSSLKTKNIRSFFKSVDELSLITNKKGDIYIRHDRSFKGRDSHEFGYINHELDIHIWIFVIISVDTEESQFLFFDTCFETV